MTTFLSSILFAIALASPAHENLLVNGDFQQGLAGWSDLWTRTPGGKISLDAHQRHGGAQAARIEHTGKRRLEPCPAADRWRSSRGRSTS